MIETTLSYAHNAELNCITITHAFTNGETKEYLFDYSDLCKILNYSKSFLFHEKDTDYPSFIYNEKSVNYLEFLYKNGNMSCYNFLNGNKYDLRSSNIKITHRMHKYVTENYQVIEYIPGHYPKYKHSNVMKNPMWKIVLDGKEKYLMYCEPGVFCILCKDSYQKIVDFENLYGIKTTFFRMDNGYIATRTDSTQLYIHQIIMDWYGNGKGTKNTSIDHLDRNPLNNTLDNLRIATREEQEQNSKGIMPNTKRERQAGARELPEGIDQSMLRKYVVYYLNVYNKEKNKSREYFRVEDPRLDTPWESSKSEKVSIIEKLENANRVAADLDRGIYPVKETPQYPIGFSIIKKSNGKSCLVFDKRSNNGERYNMRATIGEGSNITEEIEKMREKLVEKYGQTLFS